MPSDYDSIGVSLAYDSRKRNLRVTSLLDFLQKTKKDHGGGISRAPSGQYARILAWKKIFVKFLAAVSFSKISFVFIECI